MLAVPALTRFVSRPVPNRGDGTWTLYIARRVTSAQGSFLGFVLGAVELGYFEKLYARVAPEPDSVVALFRTDGVLVARHPVRPDAVGRFFPGATSLKVLASVPSGFGVVRLISPIDGQDCIFATAGLSHYPLVLSVSRTADAALAAWREQAAALGVAVALLVAGLSAVVWTGTRQIGARERLVRSEAARVAAEERARGERILRQDYARFGAALDSMSQGFCLLDSAHDLVVLNARFAAMYGVPDALRRPGTSLDAPLEHLGGVLSEVDGDRFAAELRAAAEARVPAALTCELADGRIFGVSAEPVAGGGFVCTHEDETERRRAEATIAHMAHHDALTGLPNRLPLGDGTGRLLASAPLRCGGAVLLLHPDGFKQVNDVHGHPFGDALLRQVAARPAQFREGELLAEVVCALAASGLPARRLDLEITESVLLRDDVANLSILEGLHRIGVRIAMDDFGTGYSSLSYLRRFPFDKIKSDQSFVRNLSDGRENVAIVRAAIGLGRALGMTVLAEGVETADERDVLAAEGCHELQGYLFGRPGPLADMVPTPGRAAA